MPRPFCPRHIAGHPAAPVFKPAGIPLQDLDEIVMTLDEFEALRLADFEGLYQEQAAERMAVSRPTFSRIIDSAHRKTIDALLHGKSLRIEGGTVEVGRKRCCRLHDQADFDPAPDPKAEIPEKRPGAGPCRRRRFGCTQKTPKENS
ncbi:MAG: DUF134 domain-containing protein [Candidatus Aminicenantes bacterium]|nr:DUF134 domain-containing protein [Candidatus Aminicenantes bacterium]